MANKTHPIIDGKRKCNGCGVIKNVAEFKKRRDGGHKGLHARCRECLRTRHAKYEKENREKQREVRLRWRHRVLSNVTKKSEWIVRTLAKRDPKTNVTAAQIEVSLRLGICQKSGIPLDMSLGQTGKAVPFGPSIDRKDNDKGYRYDNIQIVSNIYNIGKNKHREIDFIAMCCAVAERHRDDPAVIQRLKELRNAEF